MPQVNFSTIIADGTGSANPGGNRRVACIAAQAITGNWPTSDLTSTGEVSAAPTLATGAKWALYDLPVNAASFNSEWGGENGGDQCKHMINVKMARTSKEIKVELRKHVNAKTVWLVEGNDDLWYVVGSKQNPVTTKRKGQSGTQGTDARGHTIEGESDGNKFDICPLDAATAAALAFDEPVV